MLLLREVAGKSWLALHLVLAVASGGVALGTESVEVGEALYLALEDPLRRLQDRVRRLWGTEPVPAGAYLQVAWPRLHQGGAEQLDAWLTEHPACRLVVDTLAKIKPPGQGRGSIYDEEYAALGGRSSSWRKRDTLRCWWCITCASWARWTRWMRSTTPPA